jgi:hypothetical protein
MPNSVSRRLIIPAMLIALGASSCAKRHGSGVHPPKPSAREIAAAEAAAEPVTECVVQVGADSSALPPFLEKPPEDLGTYRFRSGHAKLIRDLRLWVGREWLPDASFLDTGSYEPYIRGAILPAYAKNGIQMGNYTFAWISYKHLPQELRLGRYRWRVIGYNGGWRFVAKVRVDKLSCAPELEVERLAVDKVREYWLSTQAVSTLRFGPKNYDEKDVELFLHVWVDERSKDGWNGELGLYAGNHRDNLVLSTGNDGLGSGPVKVKVLRVVTGHKMAADDPPEVHLLVRIVHSSEIPAGPQ